MNTLSLSTKSHILSHIIALSSICPIHRNARIFLVTIVLCQQQSTRCLLSFRAYFPQHCQRGHGPWWMPQLSSSRPSYWRKPLFTAPCLLQFTVLGWVMDHGLRTSIVSCYCCLVGGCWLRQSSSLFATSTRSRRLSQAIHTSTCTCCHGRRKIWKIKS